MGAAAVTWDHLVVTVQPDEAAAEARRLRLRGWELVRRAATRAGNVRLDLKRRRA